MSADKGNMFRMVGPVSANLRGQRQEMGIMHQETRKGFHDLQPDIRDLHRRMERLDSQVGDLRGRVAY